MIYGGMKLERASVVKIGGSTFGSRDTTIALWNINEPEDDEEDEEDEEEQDDEDWDWDDD